MSLVGGLLEDAGRVSWQSLLRPVATTALDADFNAIAREAPDLWSSELLEGEGGRWVAPPVDDEPSLNLKTRWEPTSFNPRTAFGLEHAADIGGEAAADPVEALQDFMQATPDGEVHSMADAEAEVQRMREEEDVRNWHESEGAETPRRSVERTSTGQSELSLTGVAWAAKRGKQGLDVAMGAYNRIKNIFRTGVRVAMAMGGLAISGVGAAGVAGYQAGKSNLPDNLLYHRDRSGRLVGIPKERELEYQKQYLDDLLAWNGNDPGKMLVQMARASGESNAQFAKELQQTTARRNYGLRESEKLTNAEGIMMAYEGFTNMGKLGVAMPTTQPVASHAPKQMAQDTHHLDPTLPVNTAGGPNVLDMRDR